MNEADWEVEVDRLLALGDPRGELALATPQPIEHRDLPAATQQLAATFLGPVERPVRHRVTWQHGYFEHFGNFSSSQPDRFWRELFGHESTRFLDRLSLRWIQPALLLEVLETHPLPVRTLHWNERDEPVDFDPFFAALPSLEHLHLWRPARFASGSLRPLKTLAINTGENDGLDDDLRAYSARGGLAALERLEIWATGDLAWIDGVLAHCKPKWLAFKGSITGSVLAPLLGSPAFATVEHLELEGFWPGEGLLTLVRALEARQPLESYTSTGQVPSPALISRLQACARSCSIRP